MKKILNVLFLAMGLLFINAKSYADTPQLLPCKVNIQVQEDISTDNPPKYIIADIDGNYKLPNGKYTNKGTRLTLKVLKVNKEKRGKLNASIEAKVVKVYIPKNDETIEVNNENAIVKIVPYQKIDVVDKTLDAGVSVANYFVGNIAVPLNLARGFVKNETGNRLTSATKTAYEKSVLSYASEGKSLDLSAGDSATLTFYMKADTAEELKKYENFQADQKEEN